MTLPVYVINLDRRPDRLASIAANLNNIGLPFERIPAIDAQSLPAIGKNPLVNRGSRACLLSHAEALRRFLDTAHPAAAFLQDDVEVAADLPAHCVSIDWWPAGTALVKLDTPNNLKNLQGWLCGQTPSGRDLRSIGQVECRRCGTSREPGRCGRLVGSPREGGVEHRPDNVRSAILKFGEAIATGANRSCRCSTESCLRFRYQAVEATFPGQA